MDPLLLEFFTATVPSSGTRLVTPTREVAETLTRQDYSVATRSVPSLTRGEADALLLLSDELSHAGEGAETLVAEAARVLRPGGLLVASAVGRLWGRRAQTPPRTFTADELAGALGHAGFAVEARFAPGAAARVAGTPPRFDVDADRLPGVLDAAERVAVLARRYTSERERSRSFFGSLPRKVVAAAVVCRDGTGALLVVHDSYKRHWTIPGGVVDADEDPRAAATREAYEETGLRVTTGPLLGVFSATWPDRLVFVFDATPGGAVPETLQPVHAHEIDGVAWMPLPEALETLAPHVAEQVRLCLTDPGKIWRQ